MTEEHTTVQRARWREEAHEVAQHLIEELDLPDDAVVTARAHLEADEPFEALRRLDTADRDDNA